MACRLEGEWDGYREHGRGEPPGNQPKHQRMHLLLSNLVIGSQRIRAK
jgi:hypothetical protein